MQRINEMDEDGHEKESSILNNAMTLSTKEIVLLVILSAVQVVSMAKASFLKSLIIRVFFNFHLYQ